MRVQPQDIPGVVLIEPRIFADERGIFLESYQSSRYAAAGLPDAGQFVQDNHSRSYHGVLRGLHFQVRDPQAQLVHILRGRIFDVVVDLRRGSPSFGNWCGVVLDGAQPTQLFMPPGCAHGFCVLSDVADVHYKVTRLFDPTDEGGLLWNDATLGIQWPLAAPRVSSRDAAFPRLKDIPAAGLPSTEFRR